jgi:hypothetical protein
VASSSIQVSQPVTLRSRTVQTRTHYAKVLTCRTPKIHWVSVTNAFGRMTSSFTSLRQYLRRQDINAPSLGIQVSSPALACECEKPNEITSRRPTISAPNPPKPYVVSTPWQQQHDYSVYCIQTRLYGYTKKPCLVLSM